MLYIYTLTSLVLSRDLFGSQWRHFNVSNCQWVFLPILTNIVLVDNWLIWHEENHNEIKANPIKSKLNRTTNIFFPAARLSAGREVCLYNFFQYLYMNLFLSFSSIFLSLGCWSTKTLIIVCIPLHQRVQWRTYN